MNFREGEQPGLGKGSRVHRSGYGANFYVGELSDFVASLGPTFSDLSVPMRRLSIGIALSVQDKFDSGDSGRWPSLAESTLRKRSRAGQGSSPLRITGSLRDSVTNIYGKTFAGARSQDPRAHLHDLGTRQPRGGGLRRRRSGRTKSEPYKRGISGAEREADANASTHIPARPFMQFRDSEVDLWVERAETMIGDYIDSVIGEAA